MSTTGITKFGFHDGGIGSEQMDTAFFISLTFFVTELVYNCINENKTRCKSVHIKIFKFFFFLVNVLVIIALLIVRNGELGGKLRKM